MDIGEAKQTSVSSVAEVFCTLATCSRKRQWVKAWGAWKLLFPSAIYVVHPDPSIGIEHWDLIKVIIVAPKFCKRALLLWAGAADRSPA